jgi:perosamine synthetase
MNNVTNIKERFIEQMAPWLGEEEKLAVAAYLDTGAWLTEFDKTREFERMVADYVGARHAVALSSGTAALFAAMAALGVGPGDEVIVPDFTMIASANAVMLTGAAPILVDVRSSDLCLDLDLVEARITPRTKAITVVSLNGRAPDMLRAIDIARQHSLYLIEDAAQSLGSFHQGKHLGTFGQIGIFSFSPLKIVTTGQGGVAVTDDDELADRMRRFKDFGRSRGGTDVHESMGYNFKFTDLQAVIGIEQMRKLNWRVRRKRQMFALYRSELQTTRGVAFVDTDLSQTSPWFIDILADHRDDLHGYLLAHQIKCRVFYPPVHQQPAYSISAHYPVAEFLAKQGLWLPSSSFLKDEEIREICRHVKLFYPGK